MTPHIKGREGNTKERRAIYKFEMLVAAYTTTHFVLGVDRVGETHILLRLE